MQRHRDAEAEKAGDDQQVHADNVVPARLQQQQPHAGQQRPAQQQPHAGQQGLEQRYRQRARGRCPAIAAGRRLFT